MVQANGPRVWGFGIRGVQVTRTETGKPENRQFWPKKRVTETGGFENQKPEKTGGFENRKTCSEPGAVPSSQVFTRELENIIQFKTATSAQDCASKREEEELIHR